MNDILNGIGKNAEIETNANGGSQSKAIGAMHLFDPEFLRALFPSSEIIRNITTFMQTGNKKELVGAYLMCAYKIGKNERANVDEVDKSVLIVAKVLQEGAAKYGVNNWRLIPQEEHINHALLHYLAYLMNDKQDEHLEHCATRLMFAYATEKSEGFDYTHHVSELEK